MESQGFDLTYYTQKWEICSDLRRLQSCKGQNEAKNALFRRFFDSFSNITHIRNVYLDMCYTSKDAQKTPLKHIKRNLKSFGQFFRKINFRK